MLVADADGAAGGPTGRARFARSALPTAAGGWTAAGLPAVSTPGTPADADCIDYLFFVHDRHDGNAEAARGYIAWEQGLLAQLDADERGVLKIAS